MQICCVLPNYYYCFVFLFFVERGADHYSYELQGLITPLLLFAGEYVTPLGYSCITQRVLPFCCMMIRLLKNFSCTDILIQNPPCRILITLSGHIWRQLWATILVQIIESLRNFKMQTFGFYTH